MQAQHLRAERLVRAISTDPYEFSSPPAEHVYQDIDYSTAGSYKTPVPKRPPPAPPRPAHTKTESGGEVSAAPPTLAPPTLAPPVPKPRTRLPPPPSSQLGYDRRLPRQVSAPGLQSPSEYAPAYEERKIPPPTLPKTFRHPSLPNLAPGSASYRPPAFAPTKTLLVDELPRLGTTETPRPRPPRPPPPKIKRPSLNSSPDSSPDPTYVYSSLLSSSPTPSSQYSSSGYGTDTLYEEVEDHVYLDILPDRSARYTELDSLTENWKILDTCDSMSPGLYGLGRDDQIRDFNQKAIILKRAVKHFISLLQALQQRISELRTFCDDLDKKQKKKKSMGIAGGTTGAVGGVAAVVGVALAPATMGISLVVTAIGAGMVATAGGMGAHAAIADKKNAVDRTSMANIVRDYTNNVVDLERCMLFVHDGMEKLTRYDHNEPWAKGVLIEAQKMVELSRLVLEEDMNGASGLSTASKCRSSSVSLLHAFSQELDLYFTEKLGQKLKKSNEAKFACRVCQLSKDLQAVLDELNPMLEMLSC